MKAVSLMYQLRYHCANSYIFFIVVVNLVTSFFNQFQIIKNKIIFACYKSNISPHS